MDAVDGVIWAATASVVWFVLQYTLSAPWWRDPVGRTVIAKDLALLCLLIPACILLAWPSIFTQTDDEVIDLVSLGLVTVTMAWRSVVWWRIRPPRLPWKPIRRGEPD